MLIAEILYFHSRPSKGFQERYCHLYGKEIVNYQEAILNLWMERITSGLAKALQDRSNNNRLVILCGTYVLHTKLITLLHLRRWQWRWRRLL